MKLSVIIITKNEAANIAACLKSVAFADEFIVVDSGSTDGTVEVARALGARVEVTPDWPGFGPQKNRALDLATGDWVLSIDADERVTPELAQEIQEALRAPRADAYEIARLSNFCGRDIRHSGWWPDYVLRLFKRGTARFNDVAVHERVVPANGKPLQMRGYFHHYPYDNLDALITKVNRYSSDAAAMMYAKGRRTSVFGALGHGFWTFVRIYLIRRGFLDGKHGLVLAVVASAGSFFRYSKLMFLAEKKKVKILYTNFHGGNGGGHVTYIINLAKALSKDHQITIAAPATSRLYRYAKAIPGVTVEDMQYTTRPSSWFKDRAQLRRLIKAGGFDIIHANGSADHKQVMLATLGMRRRPRIVFTKHNDHPLASLGHKLRVALATDHAIAVSDYVHGLMQQSPYGKRPITTIRHGIDTNFFAPPPPESLDKLRAIFFGPDWQGKLLLGSAGGTDYDKGWLDLVAAVAALPPEDRSRVLLMVAGDPPNEAKLARVRELGMIDQVRFPGLLDDVRAALASCHAGFVLSYREALSFACREIMGLGLPALVSDAGGLPENVTDGVDGWIVPARDVPAITAKLRFMLDHPDAVRAMGAQARETSLRDFNLERFAAATLDVYRRALG